MTSPSPEDKRQAVGPFDWTKSIMETKTQLMTSENEAEYKRVAFIINRALSFHQDCLTSAQAMNLYPMLSPRAQYDYHMRTIRKYKRPFVRWMKLEEDEDLKLICEVFQYNKAKGKQALAILTAEQLQEIRQMMNKGGNESNDNRPVRGSDTEA